MKLKINFVKEFGPSLTVDDMILFCIYREGLWRWIGTHHREIEYDNNGDLRVVGVDEI